MKIKTITALLICLIMLGLQNLKAQDMAIPKGTFLINTGYTAPNVIGQTLAALGTGSNGSFNPAYTEFGYALNDRSVLGLYLASSSGSTGTFSWQDSLYTHYYYYSISVFTIGLSGTYHFGKNASFSPYWGGMVGYNIASITTHGDLPANSATTVTAGGLAYQFYLGASYYFIKWLGIDARLGYGNTYYAAFGLSFRFQKSQK